MGEVTNAYVILRNTGTSDLTNICATLSASDEGRSHPDRTKCLELLPARMQVLLKLTVDTGFQADTAIQVSVIASPDTTITVSQPSCVSIGLPGYLPEEVGIFEPIP